MPSLDTIRPNDVRIEASPIVFGRGREQALDGSVREIMLTRQGLRALVASSSRRRPYRVRVFDLDKGEVSGACDCAYFKRTSSMCKHVVATILVWIDQRDGVRRVGPSRAHRPETTPATSVRRTIPIDPLSRVREDRSYAYSPLEPWELAEGIKSTADRWTWRVDLDGDGPKLVVSGWPRDSARGSGEEPAARYRIEARQVPTLIDALHARPNVTWSAPAERVKTRRTPARMTLHVDYDAAGDIALTPHLHFPGSKGSARPMSPADIVVDDEGRNWVLDGVVFFPVANEPESPVDRVLTGQLPTRVAAREIPEFLATTLPRLRGDRRVRISPHVRASRVLDAPVLTEVRARGNGEWFWLDPVYRSGRYSISLDEVLGAGAAGWLRRGNDWIRLDRAALLDDVAPVRDSESAEGVRVATVGLLRARATWNGDVRFEADEAAASVLDRIARMKPQSPPPGIGAIGMNGSLRHYQEIGYEWLWWLRESGFGGILADEMGLGKTHEVMALLLGARASESDPAASRPSLVICPRSVLDHWETKVHEHAPPLAPMVFHGLAREKDATQLARQRLVLTTYGIVPRSAATLTAVDWEYVVLDEAQKIKNPDTVTARFVRNLRARHRLAITGTPIENRANELWSIMEFLIPGYLGAERDFDRRFAKPIEAGSGESVEALRRAIRPFKLRRLKRDVLTELPRKVEDYRTCRLSPEQATLYREILARRAAPLVEQLRSSGRVDYIHIFAVLTLLKRLCDHPALVARSKKKSELVSGKFEAFKELLEEIVEADEKVVVFSQYLEMLDLIEAHLTEKGIGFAKLRGGTVDRKSQIARFQNEPSCRVFVGSLLAGGLGIDLTAASVVVHYDRWWNAARENQATDRVHRVGQSRGVQVWKLITVGTVEERIDRIIREKGALMEAVVEVDDSAALKTLSRDELIELLAPAT